MSKMLVIETCNQCPFVFEKWDSDYYRLKERGDFCLHPVIKERRIEILGEIPPWCPLPNHDAPKEEK
jgi:hypothetical protein